MDRTAIGQRLRERRQELASTDPHRSISWYARKMDCTDQTIMNMEIGKARTPMERLSEYAKLLGLELEVNLLTTAEARAKGKAPGSASERLIAALASLDPHEIEMLTDLAALRASRHERSLG